MAKIGIIGSGPSGTIAAASLLRQGHEVTILDVGIELPEENKRLAEVPLDYPARKFLHQVRQLRKKSFELLAKIPAKLPFGSEFAFRSIPEGKFRHGPDIEPVYTMARGGLSNAWGANICGVMPNDLADWPFPANDLTPYFVQLREYVDCSGDVDMVDENYLFPLSVEGDSQFPLGRQGAWVKSNIQQHVSELRDLGVYAGRSKLAVGRKYSTTGKTCHSCGLCMHGCAYRIIFNSSDLLRVLQKNDRLTYRKGIYVQKFSESENKVTVTGLDLSENRKNIGFEFDRLIIGAGVLRTTELLKNSIAGLPTQLTISDSQKYLFAFWTKKRIRGSSQELANTLAQIYIQMKDLTSTSKSVHCQLYGYNDLILDPLRRRLGDFITSMIEKCSAFVLDHVMIGMVYLDSHDSGKLKLDFSEVSQRPLIIGQKNPRSRAVLTEFLARLRKARSFLGGRPIPLAIETNKPGGSQHFGSSFPMSLEPSVGKTDVWGRPANHHLTHVVDSSVLPSIPSTPTTYLVMANALRICDNLSNLPN